MTWRSCLLLAAVSLLSSSSPLTAAERSHPRLMADQREIDTAKQWMNHFPWFRDIVVSHKREIDQFLARGPIYVSPLKQTYEYQMYTCPKHGVELLFEESKPFEHRCAMDTTEVYKGGKYDMAWAGWYNRRLASHLVWMGILHHLNGDTLYASAGRDILLKFADLYLRLPTENTILGPAHVFFGTLSESFWGVDMAYGYDLLYNYKGFTDQDRLKLKESFFYPLALITQKFPESASNRQLWYNNVSAAVGFLYGDQELIDFAMKGTYGFQWQLGSALPESGFWAEWSGYHYVALRGMIHLAEMARHNGYDLYHMQIAGRTMKKMFDVPFLLVKPNYEFPRHKDSGGGNILEYAPYYEVGYAVYRDPKYLALLNLTHLQRGTQVVGETSALGKAPEPVTLFNIVPDLPRDTMETRTTHSVNLIGNGYAILRNNDGRNFLALDYGIMGGEHGHPDRLQIEYYARGRNWLVDPLNESYMNPNLQLWYRQSIAHQTLVVDQTSQTWTNGFGTFFGALPAFQVASGGSTTAYPGVTLQRTVVQVGDYFLDLVDAQAPEQHLYDLPIHSFGTLTISGVRLENQPRDLFGHKPGIPGYDQLTDVHMGRTDSTWRALFEDKGQHLAVLTLGERGTEVLQAMTPPLGGFYKQMVTEQVRLPMVMLRRKTEATRFACLFEVFDRQPSGRTFVRGKQPGSFVIEHSSCRDYVSADVQRATYRLVREEKGGPSLAAGFHVQEILHDSRTLLSSSVALDHVQCHWTNDTLEILAPEQFHKLTVLAPRASYVTLNGKEATFAREGERIVITQVSGLAITATTSADSLLFLGQRNTLAVDVWNPTGMAVEGRVSVTLASDWEERMNSQLTWWGGVVNLVATNKGPKERVIVPETYSRDVSWINGIASPTTVIPAGGMRKVKFSLEVPNNAAPGAYPALIAFNGDSIRTSLVVMPPVAARLMIPNGKRESLRIHFANQTTSLLAVAAALKPDPAWRTAGAPAWSVPLGPLERTVLDVPIQLIGYTKENQRYPIHLELATGNFRTTVRHDFYVGVASFAPKPPSLDGSWNNWNRGRPMLIDRSSQIGRLLFGNQPWRGENDLSAQIFAMYDKDYVYVGAAVTDDSVVTHWDFPRMSYPWDTDAMEVVLDTRVSSAQGHDPPTPGLYRHLSMAEYRVTDFAAEAWQGAGAGGPLLPKPNLVVGAETYFRRTASGYVMIVRYPLRSLPEVVAKPGFAIGFDVALNDNDGLNYRKNQHIWAGYTQNQSWWDMGTIGTLVFGR